MKFSDGGRSRRRPAPNRLRRARISVRRRYWVSLRPWSPLPPPSPSGGSFAAALKSQITPAEITDLGQVRVGAFSELAAFAYIGNAGCVCVFWTRYKSKILTLPKRISPRAQTGHWGRAVQAVWSCLPSRRAGVEMPSCAFEGCRDRSGKKFKFEKIALYRQVPDFH
ncbi:hypothetical protein EVAR_77199_1 [Eumeta japonica]|uniref:Uncharacterized protein n=1 Tax=Eumeta variegata TaxID=151549 RepID=A0A4C1T4M6_EUMVA|nr:hypothetical protein EVAR_77199_1 [Eumeta japonica]